MPKKTSKATAAKTAKNQRDRTKLREARNAARSADILLLQLYVTKVQKLELIQYLATKKWATQSARAALAALREETTKPKQHVADETKASHDMSSKSNPTGAAPIQITFDL
jgi:hypothetical protein